MAENATAARRTPPEKKRKQYRVMLGIAAVLAVIGLVLAVAALWYGNDRGPEGGPAPAPGATGELPSPE